MGDCSSKSSFLWLSPPTQTIYSPIGIRDAQFLLVRILHMRPCMFDPSKTRPAAAKRFGYPPNAFNLVHQHDVHRKKIYWEFNAALPACEIPSR